MTLCLIGLHGFAYGIYNWGVSLGKISIQKERQRPYYGLERVETTRRGQGQTMNDKEKIMLHNSAF